MGQRILQEHDVSLAKPNEFLVLQRYDIVLILDDSSSMNTKSGCTTRWGELRHTCALIVDIASSLDQDGIDVYFLNSGKISNVTSGSDARLQASFKKGARGGTPLTETLQTALQNHNKEKPLLIIVCSDGVPNGGVARLSTVIQKSIANSSGSIRYQLMACTDNGSDVAWMEELDSKHNEVDATDDFLTEKAQVMQSGYFKTFERGHWVAKALLGAVSKKWNCLDDRAHLQDDDTSTAASSTEHVGPTVVASSARTARQSQDACAQGCALQ